MSKRARILIVVPMLVGLLIMLERPLLADAGLFWPVFRPNMGDGDSTLTTTLMKLAGLLIIIAIEALVFRKVAELTWPRAVKAAVLINVISSLIGFFLGGYIGALVLNPYHSTVFFIFIVAMIVLPLLAYRCTFSLKYSLVIFFSMLISFASILLTLGKSLFVLWALVIQVGIILLLGFALSLVLEAGPMLLFIRREKIGPALLRANIFSYLFLLLLIPFTLPNPILPVNINTRIDRPSELILEGKADAAVEATERYSRPLADIRTWLLSDEILDEIDEYASAEFAYNAHFVFQLNCFNEHVRNRPPVGQTCWKLIAYVDKALEKPYVTDDDRTQLAWIKLAATEWPKIRIMILNQDTANFETGLRKWHDAEIGMGWYENEWDIETYRYKDHRHMNCIDSISCVDYFLRVNDDDIDEWWAYQIQSVLSQYPLNKLE